MSKRFSIIAAALVATRRSLSTTQLDHLGVRPLENRAKRTDEPTIEERSRFAFDDLENGLPGEESPTQVMQPIFSLPL